jgi:hypothetical protein
MMKSCKLSAVLLFVGLITVSAVTQVSAQNVRPFKLDGRATWDDLNNAFNPMVGAAFQDGNGTASHMGRFAATGSIFALAAPDPMTGNFPVVGTVVLVAANGDQLHTMYSGILNVNGNGVADYVFFGGSGRFFGAGGTGQIYASFDVSNGFQNVPMDVRWRGNVVY